MNTTDFTDPAAPMRCRQLLRALERSAADGSLRVVVLDHTGPVFCAGMDLTEPPDAVRGLPGIPLRCASACCPR